MKRPATLVIVVSFALTCLLWFAFVGKNKTLYLPADQRGTTHARFDAACATCHAPWGGAPASHKCLACHQRSMEGDPHSEALLARATLPRKLARLTCADCHKEHISPGQTALIAPPDFCAECHRKLSSIPEHNAGRPESCSESACHGYHSPKRIQNFAPPEPRMREESRIVEPGRGARRTELSPEERKRMRSDFFYREDQLVTSRYELSAHYGAEPTCRHCHDPLGEGIERHPSPSLCKECHPAESVTYFGGLHGAIEAYDVQPRQNPALGCGACHDTHDLRLDEARLAACEKCHKGEHAKNYRNSGHYRYLSDSVFAGKKMKGIDCAGCHMPRLKELGGATDHNETLTIQRGGGMAKKVCLRCHGASFVTASLADERIVRSNFTYAPARFIDARRSFGSLAPQKEKTP